MSLKYEPASVTTTGNPFALLAPCRPIASVLHRARVKTQTLPSLQALGKPQEAAREVRALLDLMRQNKTAVQEMLPACQIMLQKASSCLQVRDPETGEEELVKSVAVEMAKLRTGYV